MAFNERLFGGMKIDIKKVNNKCVCRGDCGKPYTHRRLNYGETVLRIKTYGASGWSTSLYCKDCMVRVLSLFQDCINNTDV